MDTKIMNQQKEKLLFPPRNIYYDKKDENFSLELDGYECHLMLTDIGVAMIKIALANTPVYLSFGGFWGYRNYDIKDTLINCEPPTVDDCLVQLTSHDEKALISIADVLCNEKCWRDEIYT